MRVVRSDPAPANAPFATGMTTMPATICGAILAPVPSIDPSAAIWGRERSFHDAVARDVDVDALGTGHVPDRLDAALLRLAGDIRTLSVLDAGCGQGDMTLGLLARGANVTALDLSPGMIDIVRRRVARNHADAQSFVAVAAPLECSGLPKDAFDIVLGKFVLHHLDVRAACVELRRILRPGGRAIFIENAGDNPVLAFARKRVAGRFGVPRLGTEDEHPLMARDLEDLRQMFSRVTAHYPVFECFILFDRQVLRFRYPPVSRWMRGLDDAIHQYAPALRRFSYRVIVELEV